MDAVLFAALVALPFMAAYVLQWLWVRRSPNKQIAQRRRTIVIISAVALLAGYRLFTAESKFRRIVTGQSEIKIVNRSGKNIDDLEYVIHYGGSESSTNSEPTLVPNASRSFATKGPLAVKNFRGRVGTNYFSFSGTVNKGQRLSLGIADTGQITARFD